MNKKILSLILGTVLIIGMISGCSAKQAETKAPAATPAASKEVTLTVGSALVPHEEILNFAKPLLKAKGINLVVKTLDDEAQLNPALDEKQIDANYFQHVPYLDSVVKEKGYKFVSVGKVHIEPIGFYSQKIKSINELKAGSKIAIPNNPSNEYRALALLESKGLIKLKSGIANYTATPIDIVENKKNFKFIEVDSAQLPRSLPDVDGAVINTNIILEAKIDPKTAIFREDSNSPYANIIVVRQGDETRPEIKTLVEVLNSADVKKFIKDKYGVAVVPAF